MVASPPDLAAGAVVAHPRRGFVLRQ
jgi:hypothetical protein